MRHVVALLATLALILAVAPATVSAAPSQRDTWIVQLKAGVNPAAAAPGLAKQHGGSVGYVYRHALNGFSFRGSAAAAAALAHNPKVTLVEADAEVTLEDTQTGATWGLDRIDQHALPLSGSYLYERTGTGVTAYIIDTGILPTHQQFGGRASVGTDLVGDGQNGIDCNGHGTHVAGTIGGATYGVAKDCGSRGRAGLRLRRRNRVDDDHRGHRLGDRRPRRRGSRRREHEPQRPRHLVHGHRDEQPHQRRRRDGRGRRQRRLPRAPGRMPATTRPPAYLRP